MPGEVITLHRRLPISDNVSIQLTWTRERQDNTDSKTDRQHNATDLGGGTPNS